MLKDIVYSKPACNSWTKIGDNPTNSNLPSTEINVEKVCGPHDKSDSIRPSYYVITTIKDLIERPKLIWTHLLGEYLNKRCDRSEAIISNYSTTATNLRTTNYERIQPKSRHLRVTKKHIHRVYNISIISLFLFLYIFMWNYF